MLPKVQLLVVLLLQHSRGVHRPSASHSFSLVRLWGIPAGGGTREGCQSLLTGC